MTEGEALVGRQIVVTRAGKAGERFAARLRACGAVPLVRPLIAIEPPDDWHPLDAALSRLDQFDWLICTSANAVAAVFERLTHSIGNRHRPDRLLVGAVGTATADAFAKGSWHVDLVPTTQTAEGLLAALDDLSGRHVLFPASDIARPTLADGLRTRGAIVTTVLAYRTVTLTPAPNDPLIAALRGGTIDAVTLTSPSTVSGFLQFLATAGTGIPMPALVCVGPVTAAAAREAGLPVSAVASDHSVAGLLAALTALFARMIETPHQEPSFAEGIS